MSGSSSTFFCSASGLARISRHSSHLSNGSCVSNDKSTFSARLWTWANMRPPRWAVRSMMSKVVRQAPGMRRRLNRPKVIGRPVAIVSSDRPS